MDSRALSHREAQVFNLLCRGLQSKEVAAKLFISPRTVDAHRRSIFEKLGVRTLPEAMARRQPVRFIPANHIAFCLQELYRIRRGINKSIKGLKGKYGSVESSLSE